MLGRAVAGMATADPVGLFEDVRFVIGSADVAAANLESPLTTRPHLDPAVHALEADPAVAPRVAAAGFDILGVANNHAGDAGPDAVLETATAVAAAGMQAVGVGTDRESAFTPVIVEHEGLRIAYLAFDVTGVGAPAGSGPGVASWEPGEAERAVRKAGRLADVVTVGLHGGIEYLSVADPYLQGVTGELVDWGADVVWGHGAHVVHPITSVDTGTGTAVVATGLGNFLFDQTSTGALLEVLVDRTGVRAWRVGSVEHDDLRVHFTGWDEPAGDAVLFEAGWWSLAGEVVTVGGRPAPPGFGAGEMMAAATGDVTGDGHDDLAVSFLRPFQETLVNRSYPRFNWADAAGRTAHLGIFEPGTGRSVWVAGSMPRPVTALAVCDGSMTLGFGTFDDRRPVAAGAWVWGGAGFWFSPGLEGPATPTCVDVDGDGATEPAVVERSGDDS